MPGHDPFRGHRFPRDVILLAVRWYCRYPLSLRDVRDLLVERGIAVDAATIHRWVRKFGPEIAKRVATRKTWRGLTWHVDETYIRVNGQWRYLWRACDQHGNLIDFRLTTRRDAAAARAFFRRARGRARLNQPLCIITDRAHAYARVIGEINGRLGPDDVIRHITRKYLNNRIESDHAALKRLLTPMRGFRSLSSAKATLSGIEAIRAIRAGAVEGAQRGAANEVGYLRSLFKAA